jgi:hypothetical protein
MLESDISDWVFFMVEVEVAKLEMGNGLILLVELWAVVLEQASSLTTDVVFLKVSSLQFSSNVVIF